MSGNRRILPGEELRPDGYQSGIYLDAGIDDIILLFQFVLLIFSYFAENQHKMRRRKYT